MDRHSLPAKLLVRLLLHLPVSSNEDDDSLSINAHAEELRQTFVAHEGKKELEVKGLGNRYTVDFAGMARKMGYLLEKNVSRLPS